MRLDRAARLAVCGVTLACAERSSEPVAPARPSTEATVAAPDVAPVPPEAIVFEETFESGSLASFHDGVNLSKHRIITDASLAHSGTRVLEMTYPAGGNGGWLTRFLMPGYDSLYVRFWNRFEPAWVGGTYLLG